jgi:hypothetical protein
MAAGAAESALAALEAKASRAIVAAFLRVRPIPAAGPAELGMDDVYAWRNGTTK